jgi:hypothetical protein
LTLPEQQSFSALHDIEASLQMAPAGLHALPLSHRPTAAPGALLQLPTPVIPWMPPKPQQSESVRHSSPVGWHPLGGWQIRTPLLYGAHARLQQLPPQVGRPASLNDTPPSPPIVPPHTSPATAHPVVPGAVGVPQVPTVAPEALLQRPPQHSMPVRQTLPVVVQNEPPGSHVPFVQTFEQHSEFAVQPLPVVRHAGLSGVQTPAPQVPLQHWAELVQAWLSEVHWLPLHFPPSHANVQHS